jgi:endonuclease/exonuclease/phosphatase family metal-dependent hydrolase
VSRNTPRPSYLAGLIEATAVFLFFYQAICVLFSVLFGVIYDALFAEIVPMTNVGLLLVVVILALLTPLLAPQRPKRRRTALLVGAVVVFLARIPLTLNDPRSRLLGSILIIAATGLYLTTQLRHGPRQVSRALVLALVVDQVLRAAGVTWDVTLREVWLPGQIVVSLVLCLLAGWLHRQRPSKQRSTGIALGLSFSLFWGAWLFLESSLLNYPNAMARWSGAEYGLFASSWPFVLLLTFLGDDFFRIRRGWIGGAILLVLLLAGLALGTLLSGIPAYLSLIVAQLALLCLLLSYLSSRKARQVDQLGPGLSLGGILFLILSFAYAFAFTYAYTLDLFRGMGLPILLLAGFLVSLPALGLPAVRGPLPRLSWARVLAIAGASAVAILVVFLSAAPPWQSQPAAGEPLRVATYNIHYGYDTDWHLSLEAQAQTIERAGAGVVALQEVDTGRPTSYMIDDALWLARRLDMEVVYLPCIEHLTGIALLSRYPVLDSDTLLLPSDLEQTGIIWAELDIGGTPVNAFAIWMGLKPEERARQIDAALPFIAAHPGPAVFGGDFNSTPDSPIYARIASAGFVDPFVALQLGSPPTDPAVNPVKRIDFVWLRGLPPVAAQVADSTASDHRLVVVKAALP